MSDVRSLLRNERASRRIQHAHASYSTGTLVCIICQHQVKSESLWEGHLKSSQHLMKLQRIRDGTDKDPTIPTIPNGKKRKARDDDAIPRKRSRGDGLPDEFFNEGVEESAPPATPVRQHHEIQIPSRPATPALKTPTTTEVPSVQKPAVDEDEWAAFEADIAAAEVPTAADAIISAPAMTAAEIAARTADETSAQRKEREEAEREGDKEDAARKLEDEFEEMEGLEARVRRLREKREALRLKDGGQPVDVVEPETAKSSGVANAEDEEDEDDEDEDEDDDWDNFRLRG